MVGGTYRVLRQAALETAPAVGKEEPSCLDPAVTRPAIVPLSPHAHHTSPLPTVDGSATTQRAHMPPGRGSPTVPYHAPVTTDRPASADSRYGNFRDPIGLVKRMVRSGDPAARRALIRAGLRYLAMPLDLAMQPWERRALAAGDRSPHPVVLVVGAPRSGTTLVGQILAAHLDVVWFSNLTELFPRSPLTASRWFGRRRRPASGDFHSYYGNTSRLTDPSDGFELWNRWLGEDRYHAPDTLAPEAASAMRRFIGAWTAAFDRPLVNKNNRNTGAIALLAAEIPAARFVVVERDPRFVAQSLLLARRLIQGDASHAWGYAARDAADGASIVDAVADQVADIHRTVREQVAILEPSRIITLGYESVCDDPAAAVAAVAARFDLETRHLERLAPLAAANRRRLSDDEFGAVTRALERRMPPTT